jgi:hypothetical protein
METPSVGKNHLFYLFVPCILVFTLQNIMLKFQGPSTSVLLGLCHTGMVTLHHSSCLDMYLVSTV